MKKKIKMGNCQIIIIAIFLIIIVSTVVLAESPNAPPTPTIDVDNKDVDWYQPITVSGSCHTNQDTNEPIKYFRIRAKYTDQQRDLGEWQLAPDGQDPSHYIQKIPGSLITRTGTIEITVKAIDEANRPSLEPAIIQVTVHLPGEPPLSSDEFNNESQSTSGFGLLALIASFIIAIIIYNKRMNWQK